MKKVDIIDYITGDIIATANDAIIANNYIRYANLAIDEVADDGTIYVTPWTVDQMNEFGGIDVDSLKAMAGVEIYR